MKWYDKPITWKGYGVLGLISIVIMIIYEIIVILEPDWLDDLADKIEEKIRFTLK